MLFGPDREVFKTSLLVGMLGPVVGLAVGRTVLPPGEFSLLLALVLFVPMSVLIGYVDGGLASTWVVIFPTIAVLVEVSACGAAAGFCVPPTPGEVALWGVAAALGVGTSGYVVGRVLAGHTDDPP